MFKELFPGSFLLNSCLRFTLAPIAGGFFWGPFTCCSVVVRASKTMCRIFLWMCLAFCSWDPTKFCSLLGWDVLRCHDRFFPACMQPAEISFDLINLEKYCSWNIAHPFSDHPACSASNTHSSAPSHSQRLSFSPRQKPIEVSQVGLPAHCCSAFRTVSSAVLVSRQTSPVPPPLTPLPPFAPFH